MEYRDILESLVELLAARNIEIRNEALGGGGGLCILKNKKIFFLDTDAGSYESALLAAKAVLQVIPDLEGIFLKPAVRDFLDRIQKTD